MKTMAPEVEKKITFSLNMNNILTSITAVLAVTAILKLFSMSTTQEVQKAADALRDKSIQEMRTDIKEVNNKTDLQGERLGRIEYIINNNQK